MRISTPTPPRRWSLRTLLASTLFVVGLVVLTGCIAVSGTPTAETRSAVEPDPVPTVVVVDASDSMNTADAPGPRIDAAKSAVTALAQGLPAGNQFGVVAFGAEMPAQSTDQRRGCTDVTTPVAMGPLDTAALSASLARLQACGFTPIGTALQTAARQLPAGPSSIVLVSDGESTCLPDPCETAAAIRAERPDVTISAVGFRTDADSLKCIAEKGGGLFITADNAEQLTARLLAAQNTKAAASRLSPTSRSGISIGQSLDEIRSAHPDFPTEGRSDGDRVIYVWLDCEYTFGNDELIEIAPGNPPGSAGTTIDGVTSGTPGRSVVELYGEPRQDSDGMAYFAADESAGTAYRIGYDGGSAIAEGTVRTVVLCKCLPKAHTDSSTGGSGSSGNGPQVFRVVAVDTSGEPTNGFQSGPSISGTLDADTCYPSAGAATPGVYQCGTTADSATTCWPGKQASGYRVLHCARDPWTPELFWFSLTGTLPDKTPEDDQPPWAVELADGSRCTIITGGAWPKGPAGYLNAYYCTNGSAKSILYSPNDSRVTTSQFEQNGWQAYRGEADSTAPPTLTPVTKVYYSAAAD